jgi:hypothetical protein
LKSFSRFCARHINKFRIRPRHAVVNSDAWRGRAWSVDRGVIKGLEGSMASSLVDTVREVLPIPDRKPVSLTTYDAKDPDTRFPPIRPLRPPAGAPNVLVILLDDVGFGASSAFGGPCQTPNAERLAKGGLKYIRFHASSKAKIGRFSLSQRSAS